MLAFPWRDEEDVRDPEKDERGGCVPDVIPPADDDDENWDPEDPEIALVVLLKSPDVVEGCGVTSTVVVPVPEAVLPGVETVDDPPLPAGELEDREFEALLPVLLLAPAAVEEVAVLTDVTEAGTV